MAALAGLALVGVAGAFAVDARASESRREGADQPLAAVHQGHRRGHGPKGTVWVVNRDQGSLTIFEAATGEVLTTVESVGTGAHDICLAERAGKAFVMAEGIDAVTVVDMESLETETIPVTPMPHHCELSPNGRTLYVSLSAHTAAPGAPQLAEIDVADHGVDYLMTSANLSARAHGPALSPSGRTLYVAHDVGDELTAVDLRRRELLLSVKPILCAEEVIASRFHDSVWVSSRQENFVRRVDRRTGATLNEIAVAGQPESLMLTPSERTIAVSLRGSPATIALADTATSSLVAAVPIASAVPCGLNDAERNGQGDLAVMSDDGRYVFATYDHGGGCQGGVSVVDVRNRRVVATWPYPGTGRPHGIAYSDRKPRFRVP